MSDEPHFSGTGSSREPSAPFTTEPPAAVDSPASGEALPPEKKGSGGLTFLSILMFALAIGLMVMPFIWGMDRKEFTPKSELLNPWTEWLGDLHVLVLHLPIGIFSYIFIMEILGLLSFRKFKPVLTGALFLGAMSALVAAVFGYFYFMQGDYGAAKMDPASTMGMHMWMSILFAVFFIFAFVSKAWSRHHGTTSPIYGIFLLFAAAAMGYGAHKGGELVHEDKSNVFERGLALIQGKTPEAKEPMVIAESAKPAPERLAYEEVVKPILVGKCWECHAPAPLNPIHEKGKVKGKLDMTTLASLMKDDDVVVPGNSEESEMIYLVKLPLDDEDHMPPSKHDQLTEGEIVILEWWINKGLVPGQELGGPDRKVAEIEGHEPILDHINAFKPVVFSQKHEELEVKPEVEQPVEPEMSERQKLEEALQPVLASMPGTIDFQSQDSNQLFFTSASFGADFNDANLAELEPVAGALVDVNIIKSGVTDEGMKTVAKMPNLKRLMLNQTAVGDAGVREIATLPNLESLSLFETQVGDEGVLALRGMTSLKRVFLTGTNATEGAVAQLQEALPELKVEFVPKPEPEPVPQPEPTPEPQPAPEPQPEPAPADQTPPAPAPEEASPRPPVEPAPEENAQPESEAPAQAEEPPAENAQPEEAPPAEEAQPEQAPPVEKAQPENPEPERTPAEAEAPVEGEPADQTE